jgi:hypothetical protein
MSSIFYGFIFSAIPTAISGGNIIFYVAASFLDDFMAN